MYTASAKLGLIFTAVEENIFKEATINSKSSKKTSLECNLIIMIVVTNINGSLPLLVKHKCKSSNMPYCGLVIRLQKKSRSYRK